MRRNLKQFECVDHLEYDELFISTTKYMTPARGKGRCGSMNIKRGEGRGNKERERINISL
ncbi:MAG: hypothetical protein KKE57_06580 [Proteobacteria bacterium]|nr:hypothetical protein [Pseudomonadota bacterium]